MDGVRDFSVFLHTKIGCLFLRRRGRVQRAVSVLDVKGSIKKFIRR
jgi:hypothetical protein